MTQVNRVSLSPIRTIKSKRSKRKVDREKDDVSCQSKRGKIDFILEGQKIKGKFTLIKIKIKNHWLLIKIKDRFSTETNKDETENDIAKDRPESILSEITNEELKNS